MTVATATHTVPEWGHLAIGEDGVSPKSAERLHALAQRETRRLRVPQPILTPTTKPSLHAGQVVGVLAVPGATVEILPKVEGSEPGALRRALTRMLAVAWDLPIADSESALLATQRADLLEILIRLFADRLLVAVRRGLPHRYRQREDDLQFLRGKLDISRQLARHTVRPDRLACRFEELSVDTPLNRVLKAAVARLVSVSASDTNLRRLAELSARFEFVGRSSVPAREPVRLDRTNTAFHRLYQLARALMGREWQSTTSGASEGFALLFPMNDLFEAFIGRTMRAALAPLSVRLQDSGNYALEGNSERERLFALRPDIVVDGDIVIDTKWKQLKADEATLGVSQADVYQMLAYARAYQARRLVLLYPWHSELPNLGTLRRWKVPKSDTTFEIAVVDVGRPDAVGDTLREIVWRRA
ncbi:MAG: McrC family protein [Gammaproteobacteria bacterium]|nr:McrC family protein [Gammaproteobacteria bacterium]